jgi:diamine N-acetyltransferase
MGGTADTCNSAAATVLLREITADTVRQICALAVAPAQARLVAPNALSIAQAYFEPAAWFRAIHLGEDPAGFLMLYDPTRTATPEDGPGVCWIWRLMIDARRQRQGLGTAAVELAITHVRTLAGVTTLRVSCHEGPDSPRAFYERFGFHATGQQIEDETVLELAL